MMVFFLESDPMFGRKEKSELSTMKIVRDNLSRGKENKRRQEGDC